MGWGTHFAFGDIGTQLNVNDAENDLESVKDYLRREQAQSASDRQWLTALQQENHELKMYLAALVRLPVSKNLLGQEDVARFVDLLDPKDVGGG